VVETVWSQFPVYGASTNGKFVATIHGTKTGSEVEVIPVNCTNSSTCQVYSYPTGNTAFYQIRTLWFGDRLVVYGNGVGVQIMTIGPDTISNKDLAGWGGNGVVTNGERLFYIGSSGTALMTLGLKELSPTVLRPIDVTPELVAADCQSIYAKQTMTSATQDAFRLFIFDINSDASATKFTFRTNREIYAVTADSAFMFMGAPHAVEGIYAVGLKNGAVLQGPGATDPKPFWNIGTWGSLAVDDDYVYVGEACEENCLTNTIGRIVRMKKK
jgi:hypothetical protein